MHARALLHGFRRGIAKEKVEQGGAEKQHRQHYT
jgi:hypothetical protein